MRVLRLTSAIEEKILAQRRGRDLGRNVLRRGSCVMCSDAATSALFYWTKRFDRRRLTA